MSGRTLVSAVLFLTICHRISCLTNHDYTALVINTTEGEVKGYLDPKSEVFAFYGIPYATAPNGTERFKAPLPPPVRPYMLEAVQKTILCPQAFLGAVTQEDCLVANIFVPNANASNLSVLVEIHGGAFYLGYGVITTMNNLVKSNKVIVVSFNYRLGPHGFLCLGTKDVPGNAGMKDQVALLRWVKRNIGNFGGNPNDVTISGCSAGGTSVELLMLSKSAAGLFNKVIPGCGSSIAAWAVQLHPLETAKKYAKKLNFTNTEDIDALENFYKSISHETLNSRIGNTDMTLDFVPCIEHDIGNEEEMFLEVAPVNILKEGKYNKVPMLYGFTNMEGLLYGELFDHWVDLINKSFSDFLPGDLQFDNLTQKENVAELVKDFYFGEMTVKAQTVLEFVNYITDVLFAYPILRAVKLHVEAGHNGIYLYHYTYPVDHLVSGTVLTGASHCAQWGALVDEDESEIPADYKQMKVVIRELWLNFITSSAPVPAGSTLPIWPPVQSTSRAPYMLFNVSTPVLQGALKPNCANLWDAIYETHYRPPGTAARSSSSQFLAGNLAIIILVVLLKLFN